MKILVSLLMLFLVTLNIESQSLYPVNRSPPTEEGVNEPVKTITITETPGFVNNETQSSKIVNYKTENESISYHVDTYNLGNGIKKTYVNRYSYTNYSRNNKNNVDRFVTTSFNTVDCNTNYQTNHSEVGSFNPEPIYDEDYYNRQVELIEAAIN